MRIYISGHAPRRGYAIEVEYSNEECSALATVPFEGGPVKWIADRKRAFAVVSRWNRRYATHR